MYAATGDNWERDCRPDPWDRVCPDHGKRDPKPDRTRSVLAFNPTLEDDILTTPAQALHYFMGTKEKPGFAMKGWIRVIFDPTEHRKAQRFIAPTSDGAVALGRYVFEVEDAVLDSSGKEVLAIVCLAVDYTFVYKLIDGELKITAHHSSLPLSQKTVT